VVCANVRVANDWVWSERSQSKDQRESSVSFATPLLPAIFRQHNASGHNEGRDVSFTNVMISHASRRAQTSAFGEVGALKINASPNSATRRPIALKTELIGIVLISKERLRAWMTETNDCEGV